MKTPGTRKEVLLSFASPYCFLISFAVVNFKLTHHFIVKGGTAVHIIQFLEVNTALLLQWHSLELKAFPH
jgi:hypothetical protein